MEMMQCPLSDHNGIKPEINNRKDNRKIQHQQAVSSTLVYGSKKKFPREILRYFELRENENNLSTSIGCSKSSAREKLIALNVYMKKKKSINQ